MSEDTVLHALTLQMLCWLEERPRTYGDTMEAWRTSCPRMPIWEDVVSERMVEIVPRAGAGMNGSAVRLTERGRMLLAAA
jgi:hypothetical protein